MKNPVWLRALCALLLALAATAASAQPLLMARSTQSFPEAMLTLQSSLGDHGYTISRVQRVDIGLTKSGFKTDKYRVVFFGKPKEVHMLVKKFPQLIPYLPLKITIFAEDNDTIVIAADPKMYAEMVKDPQVDHLFMRWRNDLLSIMRDMRETN